MLREYRLAFGSDIYVDQANHLKSRIATILEQPDVGALVILFSSEGGNTDQSLALHNFLRTLPVPLHMHAIGHVGSAAVPVFLAADKRTCSPLSRFFFHEYDWGFNGRQTLRRIAEADKRLRGDIDLTRKIIQSRTNAGGNILDALDGTAAPAVLLPAGAKGTGIVQDIFDLGQTGKDGMPVAIWT